MTIQAMKDFAAYVAEDELPRTGDARKFAIQLPYEIEGTIKTSSWRWEWKYSGTQEQLDKNRGEDGLAALRNQQLRAFRQHIERELAERRERLYEIEGKRMLVRGPMPSE